VAESGARFEGGAGRVGEGEEFRTGDTGSTDGKREDPPFAKGAKGRAASRFEIVRIILSWC